MAHRVFGVRHHGPGSARHLLAALAAWKPDIVLVEGPPDADSVLGWVSDSRLRPPVAILVYVPEKPGRAAFYPFATFSPEWQAIRWALTNDVPVRFMDLPAGQLLSIGDEAESLAVSDPLALLAAAAGHSDPERWWEDVVEHRPPDGDPFDAIAEAMIAVREGEGPPDHRTGLREAAMRRQLRAMLRKGFERVAVVCGAWHVPALLKLGAATADAALLRGLPRAKMAATWVPWTNERLAFRSGYGAGVTSPAWYHHLFTESGDVVTTWLARAARLLRDEDLDAPPASVVDAVRLAEALAGLRGRPLAGLDEALDAARAVLTHGSDVPIALVADRLVVGDVLGEVPADVPMVPLQRDVVRVSRRLRLTLTASRREIDLDLRRPNDRSRSHLLHRLLVLNVPWGRPDEVIGARGTFHERWQLQWTPDLSVRLVEASMWGTTAETAAAAAACDTADHSASLAQLTALAESCLLAGLTSAVAHVMRRFADSAAVDVDVGHLMDALPPLARVMRYGDVRGTDTVMLEPVVDALGARICAGLPAACLSLDDDAAAEMTGHIEAVHGALTALNRPQLRQPWERTLFAVADLAGAHRLVSGRCTRLLFDGGGLSAGDTERRMRLALSVGEEPAQGASWVQGFLSGSGLVLVHDRAMLAVLDQWLCAVPGERFAGVLPLLRRTFATFEPAERRQIGERIRARAEGAPPEPPTGELEVDEQRAAAALPTVLRMLGVDR